MGVPTSKGEGRKRKERRGLLISGGRKGDLLLRGDGRE